MNENVMKKAQELAQALAESKEYMMMRINEEAAMRDDTLADLYGQYTEIHEQIEDATAHVNDATDFEALGELTKQLDEIQEKIQAQPMAQALQQARTAFTDMMQQVNGILSSVLAPERQGSSCSGNCQSCSGCH